jgi:rhamnulokinase
MATMVAVDVGAQSGRVAVGRFDGQRLAVAEVHRFPNVPVRAHDTLHWDVLRVYDGILEGLGAAAAETGEVDSVGIDTWGVDFGLIDRAGRLVQNPIHHRDRRTEGVMERVFARVPARELYERTGIQLMPINTLFQLFAMAAADDPALEVAETLLLIPDLLHYWLSGVAACEFTNATTTQCLDPRAQGWAVDILERLDLPPRVFPDVVPPATVLGALREEVAERTRLRHAVVVAPATHDTGSAVAAVPFRSGNAVYISSGSWSLVGLELGAPLIDDRAFAGNLTNEGGVDGTFRLLRNVNGLWLLDECRKAWAAAGHTWEFSQLVTMAEQAAPLRSLIDPNDSAFLAPGDIPARIRSFCAATEQDVPQEAAAVVRCVLESLALKYRQTIELLASATGAAPPEVHIVGGGALNALLCQWTADATGLPVLAGPAEATEIGNLTVQAIALGELGSLAEAREVVRASFAPTVYEPREGYPWDEAYARLERLALPTSFRAEEAVTQ